MPLAFTQEDFLVCTSFYLSPWKLLPLCSLSLYVQVDPDFHKGADSENSKCFVVYADVKAFSMSRIDGLSFKPLFLLDVLVPSNQVWTQL